jgi:hypothetical protein
LPADLVEITKKGMFAAPCERKPGDRKAEKNLQIFSVTNLGNETKGAIFAILFRSRAGRGG